MVLSSQLEQQAKFELARFLTVAAKRQKLGLSDAMMPSCVIDSFWHEFEETGEKFTNFTSQLLGASVEHLNDYQERPELLDSGVLTWTADYEHCFGALSPLWFTDLKGLVDEKRFRAYLEAYQEHSFGRTIDASWSCTPRVRPSIVEASWSCRPGVKPHGVEACWSCSPRVIH